MEKKPLKILRTITWLPVGGIERRITALLPLLKKRGHHIEVVCLREPGQLAGDLITAGIPVHLIKLPARLHPAGLWRLARFIREGNFDIVHSHMYRSNVPTTIAARLGGFKGVLLSQIHNINTWETRRQLWLDRWLCRWRTGIIAVSSAVKQEIIQRLRIPAEKCFVIYNGIEIEQFQQAQPSPELRYSLGIKEDDFVIIMVARLVEQKNHRLVIEAAPEIIQNVPRAKFLFVGDGKLRAELEALVQKKGLESRFIFAGQRDDVPHLLKLAAVAVLPSFKEGFSNTVIEAMAAGLPVIATNVGGNQEAILDGETGFIISPTDKIGLARVIIRLAQDRNLLLRLSQNATLHSQNFSINRMVSETENLYYSLLSYK
ncbi:MAG: glycosyltransferase [Candidatus Sumerlaeia bacterium]|nr:glycosyltransferase [Candidatus Sumerlaeia bacterium]